MRNPLNLPRSYGRIPLYRLLSPYTHQPADHRDRQGRAALAVRRKCCSICCRILIVTVSSKRMERPWLITQRITTRATLANAGPNNGAKAHVAPPRIGLMPIGLLRATVARSGVAVA